MEVGAGRKGQIVAIRVCSDEVRKGSISEAGGGTKPGKKRKLKEATKLNRDLTEVGMG